MSLTLNYFMATSSSNEILTLETQTESGRDTIVTVRREDLGSVLDVIEAADLQAEVRIIINLQGDFVQSLQGDACWFWGCIAPTNIERWFENYASLISDLAEFCDDHGADILTPFTEMTSLAQYPNLLEDFFDEVDPFFSGEFAFEEAANNFVRDVHRGVLDFGDIAGTFWEWQDQQDRLLNIEWSCWQIPVETQMDQRFSVMPGRFTTFWSPALDYYMVNYPNSSISFGELGVFPIDGWGIGGGDATCYGTRDDQEAADILAASLVGAASMGVDGLSLWSLTLCNAEGARSGGTVAEGGRTFVLYFNMDDPRYRIATAVFGRLPERDKFGRGISETISRVLPSAAEEYSSHGLAMLAIGVLEYSQTIEVAAYLDWKTVPLSETATWGLPGCNVKSVKTDITSDKLFIELELHENGLASGNVDAYGVILLLASGDRLSIVMMPGDRRVVLEYDNRVSNQYVDTISGAGIALSPQKMSVSIPISILPSSVSREDLCDATFSLVLEASQDNHDERFWFPGQAAVDCQ